MLTKPSALDHGLNVTSARNTRKYALAPNEIALRSRKRTSPNSQALEFEFIDQNLTRYNAQLCRRPREKSEELGAEIAYYEPGNRP